MSKDSPILITGVPRSGSSMIAATIKICGAFSGHMSKRGMYSNDRIREEIVIPYLLSMGADVDGLVDPPMYLTIPVGMKQWIDKIMEEEGYMEGSWMYKDSRSALIWQLWDYAYPDAKWVIVRRKPSDIVKSCMETKYMTAYSDREGWLSMIHMYESRFTEMITKGLNCKVIWPERMVSGDYQQIYELCEWVGLDWNPKALNFINTLLWGKQNERRIA